MANVTTRNPLVLDTGSAVVLTAEIGVTGVRWVGATTAAHVAVLTDTAGNEVWKAKTSAANLEIESRVPFRALGLKTGTLDSGVLYVYLSPAANR